MGETLSYEVKVRGKGLKIGKGGKRMGVRWEEGGEETKRESQIAGKQAKSHHKSLARKNTFFFFFVGKT